MVLAIIEAFTVESPEGPHISWESGPKNRIDLVFEPEVLDNAVSDMTVSKNQGPSYRPQIVGLLQ